MRMHPLVMSVMDLMARNLSNAIQGGAGGAHVGDSVLYLDSINFSEDARIIGSVDDSSSSRMSGIGNTTTTTTSATAEQQDGLARLSGLAVLLMNGESTSIVSPTDASASLAISMNWMSLVVAVALSVIVLLTIGGNLLILAAVLFNSNLRGPTHILIANLAVADLLLGFLVLPFSATLEVTGNWYFGSVFCDVWAAVDVLCCTASIMSLCVISVDRYIGVTRPLNYYSIVTAKRSTVLCLIVWISSLSISIGPLLGWKERSADFSSTGLAGNESSSTTMSPAAAVSLPTAGAPLLDSAELQQACNVNKEKAYVLFSTIGSFYLPTLIILAIYWRIYRTAVKQTKFLESGTKTDKSTSSLSGSEVLTLRVHVGRANPMKTVATTTVGHHHHHHHHHRRPSPPNNHLHVGNIKGRSPARPSAFDSSANISDRSSSASSSRSKNHKNCRSPHQTPMQQQLDTSPPPLNSELAKDLDELATVSPVIKKKSLVHHFQKKNSSRRPSSSTTTISSLTTTTGPTLTVTTTAASFSGGGSSTGLSAKMFKFRRQKKAAKTLGIVVGAFLLCWFPFFVILPVEALCSTCNIPSPLFSCCFWLGYCNSCLNPFIYASTSREFKRAFSKILCGRRGRSSSSSQTSAAAAGRHFNQPHHSIAPPSHFRQTNSSRNPSVENVSTPAAAASAASANLQSGRTKAQVSAAAGGGGGGAVDQCASNIPDH